MSCHRALPGFIALLVGLFGCDRASTEDGLETPPAFHGQEVSEPPLDDVHRGPRGQGMPGGGAPETTGPVAGQVTETMDAGGYTYVRVQTDHTQVWAAVPRTQVAVGDRIELPSYITMRNFTSPTLNRTFDEILFAPRLDGAGRSPPLAGTGRPTGLPPGHPPAGAVTVELPPGNSPMGSGAGELPPGHPPLGAGTGEHATPP